MEIRVALDNTCTKYPDYAIISLSEQGGTRKVAMHMENYSFGLLSLVLQNTDLKAPLVHASLFHCVQALQGDIEKIQIYDADGFFKTKIFINDRRADRTYTLEINVLDGIIIASICRCPIFILEEVFQKYSDQVNLWKDNLKLRLFEEFDHTKAT